MGKNKKQSPGKKRGRSFTGMIRKKNGSVTVLLTLLLTSMIFFAFVLIRGAETRAEKSYCDAVLSLAGRSVLSEFDLELKERYRILAYYGSGKEAEKKLRRYARAAFSRKKGLKTLNMELKELKVFLKEKRLDEPERFEEAILAPMKFLEAKNRLTGSGEKKKPPKEQLYRKSENVLRNQAVLAELPSGGQEGRGFSLNLLTDGGAAAPGMSRYLISRYLKYHFKSAEIQPDSAGGTFFENEKEYILYGKKDDRENYEAFLGDLMFLRTGLNLAHIYADRAKTAAVAELAAVLTPGPAAAAAQALIAAAWAAAEARNDIILLKDGKNVALFKNGAQWALDLDQYQRSESGAVVPADTSGMSYDAYLQMFLLFQRKEIQLTRAMDLIQLNLKGDAYRHFRISDCYTGLCFQAGVNGNLYEYDENY